jgi:FkbM family methyltransferase
MRAPLRLVPSNTRIPILQGPLRGHRWIVGSSTHGCWLGTYEFHIQRRFADLVTDSAVVYDIGANVGFYTLLAAKSVGARGLVVSFEPLPRNVHFLRAHLALNHISNVMIETVAVADRSGPARFERAASPTEGRLSTSGTMSVNCVALDDLVAETRIPPPTIVKIDVEGGELQVLEGAAAVLAAHKPVMIIATHSPELHRECMLWLATRGFRLEVIARDSFETSETLLAYPPAS